MKPIHFGLALATSVALLAGCGGGDDAPNTISTNRQLGLDFYNEAFNATSSAQSASVINRITSSDYIQHNPLAGQGQAGLLNFLSALRLSIPDVHATVRDAFATRDRVVVRLTITGTLTGEPFLGIAATGQRVEFDIVDEWSVRAGKLYEHWDQIEWVNALVQLGVQGMPAPFVQIAQSPSSRGIDPTPEQGDEPSDSAIAAANAVKAADITVAGLGAKSDAERLATWARTASADYIQHDPFALPGPGVTGYQSTMALQGALNQLFPGLKVTLREAFASETRAFARWTFQGKLTGAPFLGIPATGQVVEFDVVDIWTIKDGKLYEHWDGIDWPRLLVQLGVTGLPAPFVFVANQPISR